MQTRRTVVLALIWLAGSTSAALARAGRTSEDCGSDSADSDCEAQDGKSKSQSDAKAK
jgi:hypothetical protein